MMQQYVRECQVAQRKKKKGKFNFYFFEKADAYLEQSRLTVLKHSFGVLLCVSLEKNDDSLVVLSVRFRFNSLNFH